MADGTHTWSYSQGQYRRDSEVIDVMDTLVEQDYLITRQEERIAALEAEIKWLREEREGENNG